MNAVTRQILVKIALFSVLALATFWILSSLWFGYPKTARRELTDLFTTLLTPIIAIIATYVAYQQYRLARNRENRERFDKMYAVYKAVMEFIGTTCRDGKVDLQVLNQLARDTSIAYFIFGKDVNDFVAQLEKDGLELYTLEEVLTSVNEQEARREMIMKRLAMRQSLKKQFDVARAIFKPYLSISS